MSIAKTLKRVFIITISTRDDKAYYEKRQNDLESYRNKSLEV